MNTMFNSPRIFAVLATAVLMICSVVERSDARDELCDSRTTNCRIPLMDLIASEQHEIDVGMAVMEDHGYVEALIRRYHAGVRIRILMDARANAGHPATAIATRDLAAAGIPMRKRVAGGVENWKAMIFTGLNTVYFGSADFNADAFVPAQPRVNYVDETMYFTDDPAVVQSFMTRFDDAWVDTTNYANFANAANSTLARAFPSGLILSPDLNFPPGPDQDYANRAVTAYDAETANIDVMMPLITDQRHTNAIISAVLTRSIPVRLLANAHAYRNKDSLWDAWNIDRLFTAGVSIKMTSHAGQNHGKLVLLHKQTTAIFGSSNWSPASANSQHEHNYFTTKTGLFNGLVQYFEDRWNSPTETSEFVPLPPDKPTDPTPADRESSVPSSGVVLKWFGGSWAHRYDVYFGTTSPPPLVASNLALGPSENGQQFQSYRVATPLEPGRRYYWYVVSKTMANVTESSDTVWTFTTSATLASAGSSAPFTGTPVSLPGKIQAENYDLGGEGIAYHDTTPGNNTGLYRSDDVDIQIANDSGGGYKVKTAVAGEWLNYSVSVSAAGPYIVSVRVSSNGTGGTFHIESNGTNVTGSIGVPNTGSWDTFTTVTRAVTLNAGQQILRLVLDSNGGSGLTGNFNWIDVASSSPPTPPPGVSLPFTGTPVALPGTIQAENYDLGGEGIAYHDTTPGNSTGLYRHDDVDLQVALDTGGGYKVKSAVAGEWLNYSVNVTTAGTYIVQVRVSSYGTGGTFHIEANGTNVTGAISVPNTGSWDTFTTVTRSSVPLAAGTQILRLVMDSNGSSGLTGNFNWIAADGDPCYGCWDY